MRVAILDDYQQAARSFADWDSLGAEIAEFEIAVFTAPFADVESVVESLAGFDVLVAMRERTAFPAEVLHRLPELRLLVTTGPRNAAIDLDAARAAGITVCGTGYFSAPTVEMTWALILAAARNLPAEDRAVREGGWQHTVGMGLHGKTLGLIGLGRLGSQVAGIGQAFGMHTVAWSQNLTAERATEHGARAVELAELLSIADIVSVHVVESGRTRGLIGERELAMMRRGALLVNTSRGPIVDEDALLAALHRGGLRAALDVYDREPLPAQHPLRSAPNTVLSPHIGYVTDDLYRVFYHDAVEDIAAFAAGEPVRVLNP